MHGRLSPGAPLPSEAVLAEQFGVNRSTIREGIRLLEQLGLVDREGGKRLRVTIPHYKDLATRASRALVLHQVTFRELWETSLGLELMTVQHASEHVSAEHLAKLEENVASMRNCIDDTEEFVRLDIAFHQILAEAASNKALLLAREPISLLFFPAGRAILPRLKTHQRVIDAHQAIVDALKSGSSEEAFNWMRKHMEDFKRAFERTGLSLDEPLDFATVEPS
jgi:DNA-binding FadR family transcriptional regulator